MKMAKIVHGLLIVFLSVIGCAIQEKDIPNMITELEILAQDLRYELLEFRNEVESKLRELKRKEIDYLHQYFRLKEESAKRLNKDIKVFEEEKEELILDLKLDRMDLRLKISKFEVLFSKGRRDQLAIEGSRDVPKIFFRANVPEKIRFNNEENITFTHLFENAGQGYNNETGTFTAPLTGTYFFILQICTHGSYADVAIMKNIDIYGWLRFATYYVSCQNLDYVTTMQAGDMVFLKHIPSWDYTAIGDNPNILSNTFVGILIA